MTDVVSLLELADELDHLQKIADATPDGQPDGYSETQAAVDECVAENWQTILAALRTAPVPQCDAEPVRESLRDALGLVLDAIKSEVKVTSATPLLKRRFADAEKILVAAAAPARCDAGGVREALEKIKGQAHAGALLGGQSAYNACLAIEGIIARFWQDVAGRGK